MSANDIDYVSKNHESISKKMESFALNSIRKILTDEAIKHSCDGGIMGTATVYYYRYLLTILL